MLLNKTIEVIDCSSQPSLGIKGSGAADWLIEQNIIIPSVPNHWVAHHDEVIVLRLGVSEFLVQQTLSNGSHALEMLEASLIKKMDAYSGVYHVPRADTSLQLKGGDVPNLLSKVCRLDVQQLLQDNALVMTQIAGINAILLKASTQPQTYHLWFDFSYQNYLLETLASLATAMTDIELVN